MQGYDYSRDNLYYVTICVHDRVCCFGTATNGEMILNEYGQIAQKQWQWLAEQYKYVVLHEHIVMPDHIHGIIEINRANISPVGDGRDRPLSGEMPPGDTPTESIPAPTKIKSLSELMGAFKTTTSKQIHLAGFGGFKWQRSFHDRIIRDWESYYKIAEYIRNNPLKWHQDP
jgi:putative transposase